MKNMHDRLVATETFLEENFKKYEWPKF